MFAFKRFDESAVEFEVYVIFLKQGNKGAVCNWPYSSQLVSNNFVFHIVMHIFHPIRQLKRVLKRKKK